MYFKRIQLYPHTVQKNTLCTSVPFKKGITIKIAYSCTVLHVKETLFFVSALFQNGTIMFFWQYTQFTVTWYISKYCRFTVQPYFFARNGSAISPDGKTMVNPSIVSKILITTILKMPWFYHNTCPTETNINKITNNLFKILPILNKILSLFLRLAPFIRGRQRKLNKILNNVNICKN